MTVPSFAPLNTFLGTVAAAIFWVLVAGVLGGLLRAWCRRP